MATARAGPSVEFARGPAYVDLHALATATKPDFSQDPAFFGVAILKHEKDTLNCHSDDFLWFKVKAKHTVGKLRKAYQERTQTLVSFTHPGYHIFDDIPMSDLNHRDDNIVVFVAHAITSAAPASTSAFATSVRTRTPLQAINTQLQSRASIPSFDAKPPLNASSSYGSPHPGSSQSTDVTSSLSHSNENSEQQFSAEPRPSTELRQCTESRYAAELSRSTSPFQQPALGLPQGHAIPPSRVGYQSNASNSTSSLNGTRNIDKGEHVTHNVPASCAQQSSSTSALSATKSPLNFYFQNLIEQGSPTLLEIEAKLCQSFLDNLKQAFIGIAEPGGDASHWLTQIEALQKSQISTPTIIGVVGNTGAGKSSVINAILEEERLVPTNCFRACTSVVTEISWNSSNNENEKYRAEIEFIQAADWEKDLRLSLEELIDSSGNVSRECTNVESEAGVAYAKIKAVYPAKTKEQLANSTVNELMNESSVRSVLGTIKKIVKGQPDVFSRELQKYVDSKEKSTGDKKKEKGEKVHMEFWPLIKVVRIYAKADALSTGAVIVDLPGVHDSNAARAAVAAGYMKQCTGLWIVAPITRAVDDKAAKSLLGESFKRQLKYDGTYSRVTFICSKTDDISITEASDSLGMMEEMASDWEKIDNIKEQKRIIKCALQDIKESRSVYGEVMSDADDGIELWEKLKEDLEDGKEVMAPSDTSKKRKRSGGEMDSRKKSKRSGEWNSDDDDFLDNSEHERDSETDADDDPSEMLGETMRLADVEEKLAQLKADKKQARRERLALDDQAKSLNKELNALERTQNEIETAMSSICIAGRNRYSKGAIQQDFAAGIRELDQEAAIEEDEANFDPEVEVRDYQEVARSLPVFCVSSRAYQKLSGRMQRDPDVPGFQSIEETEIPKLQAHCKKLTEAGRASNCRQFLNALSQLINSLLIWASNDGTGLNLSDAEMAVETRSLKDRLSNLEKKLEDAVKTCLQEMDQALVENIFENCDQIMQVAVSEANNTVARWHAPVNRINRSDGGFHYSTYKALTRRSGVFTNAQGPHDLNQQLTDPIIKHLANHWERVFARRLPNVLQSFTRRTKLLLETFHQETESRSLKAGAGVAGLAMLGQQLKNYEAIFETLATHMVEFVNGVQREANREFTPVIARHLASAYEYCASESGAGCFMRMKSQMSTHVDAHRSVMFKESCDEVKKRLIQMCRLVEEHMANKADEVFINMQRDYLEVVSGSRLPDGQVMPRWERQMRSGVSLDIGNFVKSKVNGSDELNFNSGVPENFPGSDVKASREISLKHAFAISGALAYDEEEHTGVRSSSVHDFVR